MMIDKKIYFSCAITFGPELQHIKPHKDWIVKGSFVMVIPMIL